MKTICLMDSVSRINGGIFEAERRLQQTLASEAGVSIKIIGLQDVHTAEDRAAWSPLQPMTFPVLGPRAFGFAPAFRDALTKADADLGYLVGLWKFPSVAALGWSQRTGKPVMVAPHGMLDPWALRNSGMKKKIAGWLFQNRQLAQSACLRALGPAEAASFRAHGLKNPICVIPNGVDLTANQLGASRKKVAFPSEKKVLLYLGRLHPKKGLSHLLTAWHEVQAESQNWILVIAGWDQGGHEAELKRQATELGLSWAEKNGIEKGDSSLFFAGPRFGAEKESCYRSCDAFILPSFSEGLPMVVLEAWAYGKPVLMTPACNLPEGFAVAAGLRIEPIVASVAQGLRDLFAMSEADLQTMGRNGRVLVERQFAWRELALQMKSVYEWMLGGGSKPNGVETK